MRLQELIALNEAAEKSVVVADLWIGYINDDDREKDVTVKVFHKFKSAAEAEAFAKKCEDAQIDDDTHDDILYHMAQNGGKGDISSVHGPAYLNNVKVVSAEPKLAKKVFAFNPKEFTPTPVG